jgi:hypothetical protein
MANDIKDDLPDELDDDGPSHTSVTMKLAIIQKRCAELIDDSETDDFGGLSLADDDSEPAKDEPSPYDPYSRG